MEEEYIITLQQIRGPIYTTIMEQIPDEKVAAPIYSRIMDSIENFLEAYCKVNQESD